MNSEFLQDSGLDAILTRATRLEYRMSSAVGEILLYRKSIFVDCLHLLKEFCNLFHVKLNNSEGQMRTQKEVEEELASMQRLLKEHEEENHPYATAESKLINIYRTRGRIDSLKWILKIDN